MEVLQQVSSEQIVPQTLRNRLTRYVDQYDASAALEYATRVGRSAKPG